MTAFNWNSGDLWNSGELWGSSSSTVSVSSSSDVIWNSQSLVRSLKDVIWENGYGINTYDNLLWSNNASVYKQEDVLWSNFNVISKDLLWSNKLSTPVIALDVIGKTVSKTYALQTGYYSYGSLPPEDVIMRRKMGCGVKVKILNLLNNTEKELKHIKSIEYNQPKNSPISWTVQLSNSDRSYSKYNEDAEYYGWVTTGVWGTNRRINLVVIIEVTQGDMSWSSPYLVIKNYTYSANPTGGYEVTITGIDYTEVLLQDNVSLPTKWSRPGFITHTAHSVTADILEAVGVSNYKLTFKDYPIWKIHLQGSRPMDMLERIWAVPRAVWFWDKMTLNVVPYPLKPKGPADVTFQSGVNIKSFTLNESSNNLVNSVEIRRDMEMQVINNEEGSNIGYIKMSVSPELYLFQWRIETRWCRLLNGDGNVVYFDKDDNPIGPNGSRPVAAVGFTLEPYLNEFGGSPVEGDRPYWRVTYKGMSQFIPTMGWDQAFSVRVKNQTSINSWGERRNPDPHEDPLIPNAEWARYLGEKILEESGRAKESIQLEVLFDPYITIGQTAKVIDKHSGIDHFYFIESVSWSLPAMSCNVTAVRYTQ